MTLEQATSKIRNAWIAGLISGFLTLLFTVAAVASESGTASIQGTTVSPWNFLDVFLIFLFVFGIYMKSRVAAIGMFIYFLISKLLMWAVIPEAGVSALIGILIGIVLLYFYFEGARGTITYHRLQQGYPTVNQSVASSEN